MMPLTDKRKQTFLIGLISDTHGYLDATALEVFTQTDLIIHAGDIGKPEILQTLNSVAPVKAVRGNMDYGTWASALPATEMISIGEIMIYALHDMQKLDLDPAAGGISTVISGHSHQPRLEKNNGILYLNPGSASQPRYNHPATVALLKVSGTAVEARIIELAM